MFLVPYKSEVLSSKLTPDKLAVRLLEYVKSGAFQGSVTSEGFTLTYAARSLRSTYKPWVRGNITESANGSNLEIAYTLHPIAVGIVTALFLLALGDAVLQKKWWPICIVLVAHCALYMFSFLRQLREEQDIFRAVAGDCIPT